MTITDLLSHLEHVRKSGEGWTARCPAHEDRNPSLSIKNGGEKILLRCHAGCETESIVAVLGLKMSDLFNEPKSNGQRRFVAAYDYRDEDGALLYQCVRYEPKDFRQRRPDGKGEWIWNVEGVQRVLYRLLELLASDPEETIWIVEGEKDVENLRALGLIATCNVGGAGKWRSEYNEYFRGRKVVIIPDNDGAGSEHVQQVSQAVFEVAASVKVLALPGLPPKGDVSDWLAAGGTLEKLQSLAAEASHCTAETVDRQSVDTQSSDTRSVQWPSPPDEAAYYGLAGDIVRAIEPHTEADPVALLVQVHVGFGNQIGRSAHFVAEADCHYTNLYTVLVGRTAKGRKGSSLGQVMKPMGRADSDWAAQRKQSGLSSGEGLIWAVRDAIQKQEPIREKKRVTGYQTVIVDHGVSDKRLLVVEPEFAQTLKVTSREGNTLSPIIRQAWDSGDLRTLVKNSPAVATGAHISIIGNITREELKRNLNSTEVSNGFANRFLWVCVKRSKCLPEGGQIDNVDFSELDRRLAESVTFARGVGRMVRSEKARELWHRVYRDLSEGKPGLLGAVTSRAEAQVMRLACTYALLDGSATVEEAHLKAALALWRYCEDSAQFIFGDSLGDPMADEILRALRQTTEGMTRTDIRDLFGRNRKAGEVGIALGLLAEHGLASSRSEQSVGADGQSVGRPAERWFAAVLPTTKTTETTKGPEHQREDVPLVVKVVNVVTGVTASVVDAEERSW